MRKPRQHIVDRTAKIDFDRARRFTVEDQDRRVRVQVERPFGRPGDVAEITAGDAAISCECDVGGMGSGGHGNFSQRWRLYYPDKFIPSITSG